MATNAANTGNVYDLRGLAKNRNEDGNLCISGTKISLGRLHNGTTFTEIDTGNKYIWDGENSKWVLTTVGGADQEEFQKDVIDQLASLVEKDKEQDSEITDLKDLVNSLADSNITTEEKTYILSQLTIYGTDISVLKQDVIDLREYSDIQDQLVYDSIKSIGDQSIAELF